MLRVSEIGISNAAQIPFLGSKKGRGSTLIDDDFVEFGAYRMEPATLRLWRGGESVPLTPKVAHTLLFLVQNSTRVVSKEEMIRAIWPDRFVDEANLTQNISVLRRVLRESETQTKYIVTYPGRGYQFLMPVRTVEPGRSGPAATADPSPAVPRRPAHRWIWVGGAAVVLAVAAGLMWMPRPSVAEMVSLRAAPFTRLPGAEYQPAFSRDGTKVAFVWDQEHADRPGIFVKGLGDDQPRRVDAGAGTYSSPAWSPDGRHLAYLRSQGSTLAVMEKPERGQGEREVARLFRTRYGLNRRHLDWSPNGRQLVVDDKESPDEPFGLFLIDLETGARSRLSKPSEDIIGDVDPRFSPDGSSISFVRMTYRFNHELYTVSAAGGTPRQHTRDNKQISGQDWSPDGRSLYFGSDRDGEFRIYKMGLAGTGAGAAIVPSSIASSNPIQFSVARTGARLVYSDLLQDLNIWRVDLSRAQSGQDAWTRVIASTAEDILPQLSPDGARICFQSNRSGPAELWLADAAGGNEVQLTRGGLRPAIGRWSPDGQNIVFNQAATSTMYVVPASGGLPRLVSGVSMQGGHPLFSADGRGLYSTWNETLYFIRLPDGKPQPVTSHVGFEKILSPDGRFLYFSNGRTDPAVWRYTISTGQREKVLSDLLEGYWGAWAVSPRGIYYLRANDQPGDEAAIDFFDFETRRNSRIVAFPDPLPPIGVSTWALAPDGRFLYVVRVDLSRSDLSVVEGLR
jgi:Tol biopolymer transport system component/DNA-binding winged helix-turn-helix (wHTH) protein